MTTNEAEELYASLWREKDPLLFLVYSDWCIEQNKIEEAHLCREAVRLIRREPPYDKYPLDLHDVGATLLKALFDDWHTGIRNPLSQLMHEMENLPNPTVKDLL